MLLEWLFLGSKAAAEETFLQRCGNGTRAGTTREVLSYV